MANDITLPRASVMWRVSLLMSSAVSTSACAISPTLQGAPAWCSSAHIDTGNAGWEMLPPTDILVVNKADIEESVLRLKNRSILPISVEEAQRLSRSVMGSTLGRYYLARAGVFAGPGFQLEEVQQTAKHVQLRVLWNRKRRHLWVGTFQLASRNAIPYNIAVVVSAPGEIRQSFVECNAAE